MSPWMSEVGKEKLLTVMKNRVKMGQIAEEDLLRAEMALDTAEAQMRAALAEERAARANETAASASEKNARYMLWSVIAAAVSAIASLVSTGIAVFGHY